MSRAKSADPLQGPTTGRMRRFGERGQLLVLFAVALPVVVGFAGLAIDVGLMFSYRTSQQRGADGAALAGAVELYGDPLVAKSQVEAAAMEYADKNGYSAPDAKVEVDFPDECGSREPKPWQCVGVTITQTKSVLLLGVLGIEDPAIKTRAVAGVTDVDKNYALIVLNPTMCQAYSQSNNQLLTINGGGAIVNSDGSECPGEAVSAYQGGQGALIAVDCELATGDPVTCSVNYNKDGSWVSSNDNSDPKPTPSRPIDDPLADLVEPVPCGPSQTANAEWSNCVQASPDSGGSATNPQVKNIAGSGTVTLRPGTYYGGLKVSGSATVTFEPGLYVFAGGCSASGVCAGGGGLEKTTAAATLIGQEVTFFIARAPNASPPKRECGGFKLASGGAIDFTPPPDNYPASGELGPIDDTIPKDGYESMLFWQSETCNPQFSMDLDGSNNWTIAGLVYLPKGKLNISGTGNLGTTQIIVDSFEYTGSVPVTINYQGYVQTQLPEIILAE